MIKASIALRNLAWRDSIKPKSKFDPIEIHKTRLNQASRLKNRGERPAKPAVYGFRAE